MAAGRLQAGVAERDITGEAGLMLSAELRPVRSTGVRSPLTAKALVLSDGAETLAIVALDLYGIAREDGDRAAERIAACTGINPGAVMLVCSGARNTPRTVPVVGHPDVEREHARQVSDRLDGLVTEAQQNLKDASLGVGQARLPHLIYNHRLVTRNMKTVTAWLGVPPDEAIEPEGPIDAEFTVLVVRDGHGDPLCLLWNFAADNRFEGDGRMSPDLPGQVQQLMDGRVGRHVPCLYLPGCGGNVSFIHDLERTAEACASAVMAVQLETSCDPLVRLGHAARKMVLPIRDCSDFQHRSDVELKCPDALDAFAQELELLQKENAHGVATAVQALRLGRLALVGLPGMPFVELALEIKRLSPFAGTLVAANVNDHPGYLITEKAFAHEGFEAWTARSAKIGRGGGEFAGEQALDLLRRLHGDRARRTD